MKKLLSGKNQKNKTKKLKNFFLSNCHLTKKPDHSVFLSTSASLRESEKSKNKQNLFVKLINSILLKSRFKWKSFSAFVMVWYIFLLLVFETIFFLNLRFILFVILVTSSTAFVTSSWSSSKWLVRAIAACTKLFAGKTAQLWFRNLKKCQTTCFRLSIVH